MIRAIAFAVAAFVAGTLIALALGATNLGTAMTFGQIAFAGVVIALMLRGR